MLSFNIPIVVRRRSDTGLQRLEMKAIIWRGNISLPVTALMPDTTRKRDRWCQDQQLQRRRPVMPLPPGITGTVDKLLIDAGSAVEDGEQLVVLEAMKMETTVAARRSGIQSSHHV